MNAIIEIENFKKVKIRKKYINLRKQIFPNLLIMMLIFSSIDSFDIGNLSKNENYSSHPNTNSIINSTCGDYTQPMMNEFGIFGYKHDASSIHHRWVGTIWQETHNSSSSASGIVVSAHVTDYYWSGDLIHNNLPRIPDVNGKITVWGEFRESDSAFSPRDYQGDIHHESQFKMIYWMNISRIDPVTGSTIGIVYNGMQIERGVFNPTIDTGYCELFVDLSIPHEEGVLQYYKAELNTRWYYHQNENNSATEEWAEASGSITHQSIFTAVNSTGPYVEDIFTIVEETGRELCDSIPGVDDCDWNEAENGEIPYISY